MLIVFELDTLLLTTEGIRLRDRWKTPFISVRELKSESVKWKKESQVDADSLDQFIRQYEIVMSVFDTYSLKGIVRLEIGGWCYEKVNRFVIDGLNELKSVIIGDRSFVLDKNNRIGSKCLIMNCDQLSDTHVGENSFKYYESLELKTLPSLISIEMDGFVFEWCHRIVFDSMND